MYISKTMVKIIDVESCADGKYQYFPFSGTLNFKVRAKQDAQISLTTGPKDCDPIYEIFLGACNNTVSSIMKNKSQCDKVEVKTPSILCECGLRGFWIRWCCGVILVGKEGQLSPFMAWTDPNPFTASFFGVRTGPCVSGFWKLEEECNQDDVKYQFSIAQNCSLQFKVRAASDAQVALTTGPNACNPIYEILIGFCDNKKSAIRKNKEKPNKVEVNTPCILNESEYRGFWIRWNCGVISVGMEGQAGPFMAWTDPEAFSVCYYGIGTNPDISSTWKIEGIYQEPTKQNCPNPVQVCPKPEPICPNPEPICPNAEPVCPKPEPICPKPEPISPNPEPVRPKPEINYKPCDKDWVDASGGSVPPCAVVGGHDYNGTSYYVIRVMHQNMTIPGKLRPSDGCAYISWGGWAFAKQQYQVLVGNHYKWMPKNCGTSVARVQGGVGEQGEPLYVGRGKFGASLIPGYVTSSRDVCYIADGGSEAIADTTFYDILVNELK